MHLHHEGLMIGVQFVEDTLEHLSVHYDFLCLTVLWQIDI